MRESLPRVGLEACKSREFLIERDGKGFNPGPQVSLIALSLRPYIDSEKWCRGRSVGRRNLQQQGNGSICLIALWSAMIVPDAVL